MALEGETTILTSPLPQRDPPPPRPTRPSELPPRPATRALSTAEIPLPTTTNMTRRDP